MSRSLEDEKAVAKIQDAISEALRRITQIAEKRFYDVLVLDEIVFCLSEGLAKIEDVKDLIDKRDSAVEVILTGRGASAELMELADLVTEMKNIKHPIDKGLPARRGIEY
jgi:cob(I)alamin adenosyltransferase